MHNLRCVSEGEKWSKLKKEFAMYLKHSESPAIHSNILGRCQEVEEEEHRRQGCYIRVLSKVIIHLEEIVGTKRRQGNSP